MMGPHVYEQARAGAPIHVQLLRIGAAHRATGADSVRVAGRIVRIFRDRDCLLRWGQRVSFEVPVIDRERSEPPTPSGTIYHSWEQLGRARWLEAFLESWHEQLQLVHSQLLAIRHPTMRPVCGPDAKGFLCTGDS